jgi:hypothetical protein
MQIQELIDAAHKEATKNTEPLRETALVVFSYRNLIRYTELIIQATCDEAMKLEGTKLDD